LYLFIREATNARNLDALLPLVTPANSRRICFCTDDRQPADLLELGGIDYMIRQAITFGIEPITAIQMATLNPAERFGLKHVGAVAPGRRADIVVFDDLNSPTPRLVIQGGHIVARDGALESSARIGSVKIPPQVRAACRIDWERVSLGIAARGSSVRAIRSVQDQLVTESRTVSAPTTNGTLSPDVARDLLKMVVIERHRGTGNVGLGFIEGFGFKRGAIAGTVAHDHHNLVAIGCDDESILAAAKAVAEGGGGLAAADGARVIAALALPIAGLMSDRPIGEVRVGYDLLLEACRQLGSTLHDPFMAMSFMALEVIPELKLTDQGLIDVTQFRRVDLFV
jgi:adenine deaminase